MEEAASLFYISNTFWMIKAKSLWVLKWEVLLIEAGESEGDVFKASERDRKATKS